MMKLILLPIFFAIPALAATKYDLPVAYSAAGEVRSRTISLNRLAADQNYSLLFSLPSPARLGPDAQLMVEVIGNGRVLITKTLHAGDTDLFGTFYLPAAAHPQLRLSATAAAGSYRIQINKLPASPNLKRGGNHTWQDASPMTLGQTVFASSDEAEYIPISGTTRKEYATDPRGQDWYRFSFDSDVPKLVYFQLELTDRDDLPVDVSIFRVQNGALVEYTRGQDPVAVPHEVQALPGNKFAPRILQEKGEYFVRVRANHPEYKLRTRLYDVPPYSDAHEAVRTAVDYIMGAGDSWFANTPRRGGTLNRIAPVHQETSLCVACHASHFSQRAQLYSTANGYPVVQRQQLQFLEERFYNNPRPFYGFEGQGAVWARVISAPANVLSRMSVLTTMFEDQISREPRAAYHEHIRKYLDLYYADRSQLAADETNGNTPIVSTFEVAWYSWKTTHDPKLAEWIDAASGKDIKNTIDLCYQTLALADIDRTKYKAHIDQNVARLLSLQRPDGQWSMRFDRKEPEVEFQTGHALWALAAAGVPRDQPQVKKAIEYLMLRQQGFGGWMDPLQSFENFRTPFRETQFAVLALSSYFPEPGRKQGWNSPEIPALSTDPVTLLNQLDQVWDTPSPAVAKQIEAATASNEVFIRQAATEALGRFATASSVPTLVHLLGDESKLVQRTAAWSLRQIYAKYPDTEDHEIAAALHSKDIRIRWGATRLFAHQFASLAQRKELIESLESLTTDPVIVVRMQAIRGLWQSWFWNADPKVRSSIEDTILAALKEPQHPWIATNLQAAVYNLADENIRYLYNNWVTLLGREQDRERAIQGRLAVESQLAQKFSGILTTGPDAQKKRLLEALAQIPQRRGDIYDLNADLSKPAPLTYSRIGNDIEQIAFFGPSADILARALLPLFDSPDPELRQAAIKASLIVRETPYRQVDKVAGGRPESAEALGRKLDAIPNETQIAKDFRVPPPRAPGAIRTAAPPPEFKPALEAGKAALDEGYFRANIEPILHKKGEDGYACADCHATHTLFNATWSTVLNVVDLSNPENSLLLRKPISTAESEGITGAKTTAHGGGRRWSKGSPQYETILEWIKGAQLHSSSKR